jgi:DNA-binding transcriptional MerR regulator/methylmalonyl-CoA mutase cobalamin-binding subunit
MALSDRRTDIQPALSIAAVERETGLSKDNLRVWERRYGFPQPLRDPNGERLYPPAQVERLRLIRRLLDKGERPGQIVALSKSVLQKRLKTRPLASTASLAGVVELQACLQSLKQHDMAQLRRTLNQSLLSLGMTRFVSEILGPLNQLVGTAWMSGEIHVFEEHMYTECVTTLLRQAIANIVANTRASGPRVLLTTIPLESHGLGLLMAESLLALEGCECLSLGVQTPVIEIVRAAMAQAVNIVALSFSASLNTKQVLNSLNELRTRLPVNIAIWVGGSHAALKRSETTGITPVQGLTAIKPMLAQWQAQQAVAA